MAHSSKLDVGIVGGHRGQSCRDVVISRGYVCRVTGFSDE